MTEQLICHVDEETARTVRAKAEREDVSISQWVGEAVTQRIEREGMMSEGQRYRVEERLLDLVDDAADQAADRIVDRVVASGVGAERSGDDRQPAEAGGELTKQERARRRSEWGDDGEDETHVTAESGDGSSDDSGDASADSGWSLFPIFGDK